MASRFKMQIVDSVTNYVVEFEPGRSVETDFVTACVNRILLKEKELASTYGARLSGKFVDDCIAKIVARGVGVLRTSKHVTQDIRDGINEAIFSLSPESWTTTHDISKIHDAISEVILELKSKVRP